MIGQSDSPSPPIFDPFQNRLCRDMRNDLSAGLMQMLHGAGMGAPSAMAAKYRSMDLEPFMENYMEDHLYRYQRIFEQIKSAGTGTDDTYGIAVLLWNQELFFEVHDWLEKKWLAANGPEKELLQALIRAAGAYVHLSHGRGKKGGKENGRQGCDITWGIERDGFWSLRC